jgi:hypothetical protein
LRTGRRKIDPKNIKVGFENAIERFFIEASPGDSFGNACWIIIFKPSF